MDNSSGNNFEAKQESGSTNNNNIKFSTSTTTPSSSRQWGGFKNPRIVRVSRAFGGKDRHSKVCTIRGLRDRRIRLSVPTAIQLYDLQERLGLSQPSKVVDWLLDVAKHDIDELPPLQIPPGYFNRFLQPPLFSQESALREKSRIIDIESGASGKNKSIASNDDQGNNQEDIGGYNIPQISAQSFFPLGNSCYQWEPSNLSLAHFGQPQMEDSQNSLPLSLASSVSFPSGPQLFFSPSPAATFPPIISPYMTNYPLAQSDSRAQFNHFQFLNSSTQHVLPNSIMPTLNLIDNSSIRPFSLNDDPRWIHSREENDDDDDDDDSQPHEGGVNS